jgi:hypothetical protein
MIIIRIFKSIRTRQTGNVARMEEQCIQSSGLNATRKEPLVKHNVGGSIILIWVLRVILGIDWFRLAKENHWRAFVNTVMNLGVQ